MEERSRRIHTPNVQSMIREIDDRPTRALNRDELINKVYDLSDENQELKDRIKELLEAGYGQVIYKEKIVTVVRYVDKKEKVVPKDVSDEDFELAFDIASKVTGTPKDLFMPGKCTTKKHLKERFIVDYVLYKRGYIMRKIADRTNRISHSQVSLSLKKYRERIPLTWKNKVDELLNKE